MYLILKAIKQIWIFPSPFAFTADSKCKAITKKVDCAVISLGIFMRNIMKKQ